MSSKYGIDAIPTMYKGVVHRSKLEATWAAFFSRMGWKAKYEFSYLNDWFPDFTIKGRYSDIFVEVKPYRSLHQFEDSGTIDKITDAANYNKCMKTRPVLLLGSHPILDGFDRTCIGWISNGGCYKGIYEFNDAPLIRYNWQCSIPDSWGMLNMPTNKDIVYADKDYLSGDDFEWHKNGKLLISKWSKYTGHAQTASDRLWRSAYKRSKFICAPGHKVETVAEKYAAHKERVREKKRGTTDLHGVGSGAELQGVEEFIDAKRQ